MSADNLAPGGPRDDLEQRPTTGSPGASGAAPGAPTPPATNPAGPRPRPRPGVTRAERAALDAEVAEYLQALDNRHAQYCVPTVTVLLAGLRRGLSLKGACGLAHIEPRTLREWRADPIRGIQHGLDEAVELAHLHGRGTLEEAVLAAKAQADAAPRLTMLERQYPDDWAPVQRLDASVREAPMPSDPAAIREQVQELRRRKGEILGRIKWSQADRLALVTPAGEAH